jgi:hypothetical protein
MKKNELQNVKIKESKRMNKTTLESVSQHLEYFGFTVTEKSVEEGKCCYAEKDKNAPTVIRDFGGGLVFQTIIDWTENCNLDGSLLLFLANTFNSESQCASFTVFEDLKIGVKAVYMGSYSKDNFADFFQAWVWDTTELIFSESSASIMHLMANSDTVAQA